MSDIHKKEDLYGQAWLMIVGNSREQGVEIMRKLSKDGFTEASAALAAIDEKIDWSDKPIIAALKAKNPQLLWKYSVFLKQSSNPLFEDYCFKAAERGCVDAMFELGDIASNLNDNPIEAMYWYTLAKYNNHQNVSEAITHIFEKWAESSCPAFKGTNSAHFSSARQQIALSFLELYSNLDVSCTPDEIISYLISGEIMAGYLAGELFKANGNQYMEYMVYNILAHKNDAHGTKCYADVLASGTGAVPNFPAALKMYERSARLGDSYAMHLLGKINQAENICAAAYWYGLSYTYGYHSSLTKLQELAAMQNWRNANDK